MIILIGIWLDKKLDKLLVSISIIQILFFFFYPYSKVKLDTLFKREVRELSLPEVAWNRLNNGYLHTNTRLTNRNELFNSFDQCVNYLETEMDEYIIFDGKTSLLTINSQVYRYPEVEFVTQKNFFRNDEYIYQKGTLLEYRYGLEELYKKVYILCDVRMLENYVELVDLVYKSDMHAIVIVKQGKEKDFRKYYESLYSK